VASVDGGVSMAHGHVSGEHGQWADAGLLEGNDWLG
jgi:hypothetical protein